MRVLNSLSLPPVKSLSSVIQKNFESLHKAIQADGYRVTLVYFDLETEEEDCKQGLPNFIYGIKGNLPLPAEKIIPHIPALVKRCNRIIYEKNKELTCGVWLTPLSRDRHHPALDDVNTPEKLAALEQAGLTPCAIIESSPNNYQYIYNTPRQQPLPTIFTKTIESDEAANAVAHHLNKTYGDAKATGIQRAFRWPGFENRKPKHKNNGKFPTVNLIYANPCQCPTWQHMIEQEYIAQADKRESRLQISQGGRTNAEKAYVAHQQDILKHNPACHHTEYDIKIATRLIVTGFSENAVAEAIHACTPWKKGDVMHYAESTTSNAIAKMTKDFLDKKILWRIVESGDDFYQNDDAAAGNSLKKHYDNARFIFETHEDIVKFSGMIMFWLGYSRQCIENSIRERYPELDAYECAKEACGPQLPDTTKFCQKNLEKWKKTELFIRK